MQYVPTEQGCEHRRRRLERAVKAKPRRSGAASRSDHVQSKPFFFRISGALSLVISMVGKVMTGGIFSPLSNFAA